jgi:hypothetical protein
LGLSMRLGTQARRPSNARSLRRTNQGARHWTRTAHLPPPKALPALNLQAGLREPPLQSPRRWSPGQRVMRGAGSRRCRRHHKKARASLGRCCKKPHQWACAGITSHRERAHLRANTGHSGHREKHHEWVCWLCRERIGHLNGHGSWVPWRRPAIRH